MSLRIFGYTTHGLASLVVLTNPMGGKDAAPGARGRARDASFVDASFRGEIIVDAKATADGITSDYNLAQLRDYELITRPDIPDDERIKGCFKGQDVAQRRVYRGVLYIVATKAVANLVKAQIERLVPDRPWDRFSIMPAPDGDVEINVTANPTFRFPIAARSGRSAP